jgi:hypothetical protein
MLNVLIKKCRALNEIFYTFLQNTSERYSITNLYLILLKVRVFCILQNLYNQHLLKYWSLDLLNFIKTVSLVNYILSRTSKNKQTHQTLNHTFPEPANKVYPDLV